MISLQVGDYWVWSLIIFFISKVLVSEGFGPQTPTKGCGGGGFPPHYRCRGVRGGSLVKYCNFIVNLDHSLCHRSDGRSYINIRVFFLEGSPLLCMRELYYDYVLF